MSKLQLLRVFLNERLTAAAVEIFGAFEKTVAEYQEENERLRRLLQITPDIRCGKDSVHFSLSISGEAGPSEQQHSEQEWTLNLGQEDAEPTLIKEEHEEPRSSQDKEQLQGLEVDSIEFEYPHPCVKSECDQQDPLQTLTLHQTHNVENRVGDFTPVDHTAFDTVTQIKHHSIPCNSPDRQNNGFSNHFAVRSDPGLDNRSTLEPNPPMGEHYYQPNTTTSRTHRCSDCGETFALKDDLQRHVTLAKKRPSECRFCKKHFNSSCKLKAHVRLSHVEKPYTCPFCGKVFKLKGHLPRHMRIHTGEKPFSCGQCGKSFVQKGDLNRHTLTHTGEKPHSCVNCGKSFNRKDTLNLHMLTHTGENVHKVHNSIFQIPF